MATIPFPITENSFDGIRRQVGELIRNIYEEKIGGADLGDVFSIVGEVFTLTLATASGLTKTDNELAVSVNATGGLTLTSTGISIDLDGSTLTLSSDGLKLSNTVVIPRLANVTLTVSDMGKLHLFDTTGGDLTAELPLVSTLSDMDWISCARIGANRLSIETQGADAVVKAAAYKLDNKDSTTAASEYSVITLEYVEDTTLYHIGKRNFGVWNLR